MLELVALDYPMNLMDVGAAAIAEVPVYKSLLDLDIAHLSAFEGDPRHIEKLHDAYGKRLSIYNDFLFDGTKQTLYEASAASGMTSLLKPDLKALKFFNGFENFGKIERTRSVQTKKLDDLATLPPIDFLKMDVQGAELTILKNGKNKLRNCVAIQLEVSHICLYEQQPSFGDVDLWMRNNGYAPHCFLDVKKWSIAPTIRDNNFRIPFNQLLESDVLYIKNPLELGLLKNDEIKKLALISHYCIASYDLSVHALRELISRKSIEENALNSYLSFLTSGRS